MLFRKLFVTLHFHPNRLAEFRQWYLPENNLSPEATHTCLTVTLSEVDWEAVGAVKQSDLDGDEAVKTPVVENSLTEKEAAALDKVRRHKNVFVPKGASLEFVPGTG